jgi:hypothetical protein
MMWQPDLLRSSCRQRRYVPHKYLDPYHRGVAKAGLLEGRRTATHWNGCDELAQNYPRVTVDPDPIYVKSRGRGAWRYQAYSLGSTGGRRQPDGYWP